MDELIRRMPRGPRVPKGNRTSVQREFRRTDRRGKEDRKFNINNNNNGGDMQNTYITELLAEQWWRRPPLEGVHLPDGRRGGRRNYTSVALRQRKRMPFLGGIARRPAATRHHDASPQALIPTLFRR